MKQAILILLFLSGCVCLFAQRIPDNLKSQEYYLHKSRNQKLAAWPLMAAGIGMTTIGLFNWAFYQLPGIFDNDYRRRSRIGAVTTLAGGGVIAGSLSLFAGARRNKQRAANMNMYLERLPITGMAGQPVKVVFPAVRVTVRLR